MKAFLVSTALAGAAISTTLIGCSPTDATPNRTDAAAPGVEDDRVETYVRARFQADDSIRASDIDVSSQNGRVTLRGTVPSDEARQRAVASAREASGAQSIDDQLVVANAPASAPAASAPAPSAPAAAPDRTPATASADRTREPGWITTKIQAQYFVNPEIRPWNIDVSTTANGVVTLRGEIDEPGDRDEAVRIARSVEGVTQVNDRLVVKADAARPDGNNTNQFTEPDGWVTAKIQAKYFMDAEVKGRDIDVDTQNGTVTLRGQVSSEAERRQAIAIARNTEGVRDVADQLTVNRVTESGDNQTGLSQTAATVDDAWITTKVQSKFFLDRDIKGSTINVNTSGGVVTLEGSVRSAAERQAAEQIARETEGVSRVNNQLKVETTR
jgi:hyperosmotically inducible periplasmic protein